MEPRLQAGLAFASGSVLRLGVVLLGCRIAYPDIAALGSTALFSIASVLFLTLITGLLTSHALGLGAAFGVLAGGASGGAGQPQSRAGAGNDCPSRNFLNERSGDGPLPRLGAREPAQSRS